MTEASSASGSEPRSIIELELMHRWSTHTYRSMCGIPEEAHYLSQVMPREALKHDFMLDGIFAVTALDIARSSQEPDATKYEHIALEYYNRGSASFRELLTDIPPDIYHLMFIFASAAAVMVLGLPQSTGGNGSGSGGVQTALERIITLADLFHGTLLIVHAGWDKIVDAYVPLRAALSTKVDKPDLLDTSQPVDRNELPFRFASLDLLDDDIRPVLARLDAVNDKVHATPRKGEPELSAAQEEERSAAHDMYRLSIFWLKEGFAEQKMDVVKGYCLSFFILAGQEFAAAAKSSQPLALFILMHWAVQLDKLGEEAWWARTVGRQLVHEVSEFLAVSPLSSMPETRDNVAWARRLVGLPT
ncbi:putative c6 transcription factor protein [Eutypa lata UCREL1]|uniref:Putative c6 transcription factor protein n=1 Tax=Eutypa lata (strain UCR-EL1) TaxID=1287681 RepID=M7SVL6_EUTLA|nr:putative c6 transcription factor protein [Eutypa lata UCREL1]